MGRRGDGETRRWGETEMGRDGDTAPENCKTVFPIAYCLLPSALKFNQDFGNSPIASHGEQHGVGTGFKKANEVINSSQTTVINR